ADLGLARAEQPARFHDGCAQDEVPIEPPASIAWPDSLSPISTCTRSIGTSSVSAAICVSTVRAPVPMSDAVMRIVKVPSSSARACAVDGARLAGYVDDATPMPVSLRPSRRDAGFASRCDQ